MNSKKLTLKELISQKDKILNNKKKTRDLYVKSLGSVITIEKPTIETIMDAVKIDSGSDSDKFLVYHCITEPDLKDAELQKSFKCIEPIEILKIFEDGEISLIAKECMDLAGYNGSVSVVDDLKN